MVTIPIRDPFPIYRSADRNGMRAISPVVDALRVVAVVAFVALVFLVLVILGKRGRIEQQRSRQGQPSENFSFHDRNVFRRSRNEFRSSSVRVPADPRAHLFDEGNRPYPPLPARQTHGRSGRIEFHFLHDRTLQRDFRAVLPGPEIYQGEVAATLSRREREVRARKVAGLLGAAE